MADLEKENQEAVKETEDTTLEAKETKPVVKDDDDEDVDFKTAFKEAWKELHTFIHPKWSWKMFFFSFAWLGLLFIGVDQLSKWLVASGFDFVQYSSVPVFDWGWIRFDIELTYNQGAAFGIGNGKLWARIVYIIISWNASILIVRYWYQGLHKGNKLNNFLWMLAFAGALGNAIDRTFYWNETVGFSGVIDFFSFTFFNGKWSFAIFNFADICLTVAVIVAIIVIIYREVKEWKENKAKKGEAE